IVMAVVGTRLNWPSSMPAGNGRNCMDVLLFRSSERRLLRFGAEPTRKADKCCDGGHLRFACSSAEQSEYRRMRMTTGMQLERNAAVHQPERACRSFGPAGHTADFINRSSGTSSNDGRKANLNKPSGATPIPWWNAPVCKIDSDAACRRAHE